MRVVLTYGSWREIAHDSASPGINVTLASSEDVLILIKSILTPIGSTPITTRYLSTAFLPVPSQKVPRAYTILLRITVWTIIEAVALFGRTVTHSRVWWF